MDLRGKRALVMGLGVHGGGLGMARFLVQQGAEVTVTDMRGPEALQPSLEALVGLPIRYVLGEHREQDFQQTDLVIRNPGVPRESPWLQIAREAGVPIEMEMTLFFRLCPAPILGVTGTKGKTTTTVLLSEMLRHQFPDTVVAGNLRISALEQLPRISPDTPVVLELSSFVLEGLGEAGLSPRYACITNIAPDHLDRYGTLAEYAEAKRQIIAHQTPDDVTVLLGNDPILRQFAASAPGRLHFVYDGEPPEEDLERIADEAIGATMVGAEDIKTTVAAWDANWYRLCRNDEVQLPGRHNLLNVGLAAAMAQAYGAELDQLRTVIRQFTGVEHRLEPVRDLNGVRYINDTAATVPEAAIAALRSFPQPVVLIAGGADKNLPFEAFADEMLQRAKLIVLLGGTATPRLQELLASRVTSASPPILGPFGDFATAVETAHAASNPGDVVLLSPGCASFGMFRNEFHRGEEFKRLVGALPEV